MKIIRQFEWFSFRKKKKIISRTENYSILFLDTKLFHNFTRNDRLKNNKTYKKIDNEKISN